MTKVLVDTGPFVALANPSDTHHQFAVEQARQLPAPQYTSWPVLTETFYLLRNRPRAVLELLEKLQDPHQLVCLGLGDDAPSWFRSFFKRFKDREHQLADASLLYLAERWNIQYVFTTDLTDFSVYRTSKNHTLDILAPAA